VASLNKSSSNKLLNDRTNFNPWAKNNNNNGDSVKYLLANKNNNDSNNSMKYNSIYNPKKTSYVRASNNFCSSNGFLKLNLADD
jgi:hypothetical protein